MRACIGVATAVALLALFPVPASALEPEVRDKAGFFSADAVSKANDLIREIKRDQKKDLLIETFPRAPVGKEDEANSADAKEKDHFFVEWALQRAREEEVNGIYVLVCKQPPYVKVAVGNQTHQVFSDDDRDRLGEILVKAFHEKNYDDGLLEGVRFVQRTLREHEQGERGSPRPQEPPPSGPQPGALPPVSLPGGVGCGGIGCGSLLCIGLVLLLVVVAGFMVLRALTRSFRGGGGYGPGGYGPGGYGPGYGPPGYGGGGGGFLSNILGGLFGGAAGSWIYDRFFGRQPPSASPPPPPPPPTDYTPPPAPPDTGYTAGGGGDFGGGGGDVGGGGDFGGGGDAGGGDAGGGGGGGDAGGGGTF